MNSIFTKKTSLPFCSPLNGTYVPAAVSLVQGPSDEELRNQRKKKEEEEEEEKCDKLTPATNLMEVKRSSTLEKDKRGFAVCVKGLLLQDATTWYGMTYEFMSNVPGYVIFVVVFADGTS